MLAQNAVILWMVSKSLELILALVWRMAGKALVLDQAPKAAVLKLVSLVAMLLLVLVQTVRLTVVLRTDDHAIKTEILRM